MVYASLFPFNFESRTLGEAMGRFHKGFAPQPIDVGDFIANILLVLPLGYFLLGTLRVDRAGGSLLATASALGFASVLSVSVEFLQAFFPPRTPCLHDILAQVLGACLGAGIWHCCGRDLTARVRHAWATGDLRDHAGLLLGLYTAGLVALTLLPFNLEYRPEVLGFKVNGAFHRAIDLDIAPAGGAVYLWNLLLLLPAGVLAAFVRADARRAAKLGIVVVFTVAAAELMVRGKKFDLFSVGIAMGSFALGWLHGRTMRSADRTTSTSRPRRHLGTPGRRHASFTARLDSPTTILLLDRMGR